MYNNQQNRASYFANFKQKKFFALNDTYYDIVFDLGSVYIIKHKKNVVQSYGLIIGFLLGFNILLAALGSYVGSRKDAEHRSKKRKIWLSGKGSVSDVYGENLFMTYSQSEFENFVSENFKNLSFMGRDGKKVTLKISKSKRELFKKTLYPYGQSFS